MSDDRTRLETELLSLEIERLRNEAGFHDIQSDVAATKAQFLQLELEEKTQLDEKTRGMSMSPEEEQANSLLNRIFGTGEPSVCGGCPACSPEQAMQDAMDAHPASSGKPQRASEELEDFASEIRTLRLGIIS